MDTLRNRLKTDTLELHRRTEARSALVTLFKGGDWNNQIADAYAQNVNAQKSLVAYIMNRKSDWSELTPSLAGLSETLAAAEKDIFGRKMASIPKFEVTNKSAMIGVGYVMLGSSMGSKVIMDRLGKIIPEEYQHFLKSMANASKSFFSFCNELNNKEIDSESAINGAKAAFIFLEENS